MNEKISALVDGELPERDATQLLASLAADDPSREAWRAYHLIGDVLRGTPTIGFDREPYETWLGAEPAILAPQRRAPRFIPRTRSAWAAAGGLAAAAALALVVTPSFLANSDRPTLAASGGNTGAKPAVELVAQQSQPPAVARDRIVPTATGVEDYLLAHQRYSPTFVMQGAVPYVRAVSEERKEFRR